MGSPPQRVLLPTEPVVLTTQQIAELNEHLAKVRHDINNKLAVLVAAMDLVRYKPESAEKYLASIHEQPVSISESLRAFSTEFEKALRINRP